MIHDIFQYRMNGYEPHNSDKMTWINILMCILEWVLYELI